MSLRRHGLDALIVAAAVGAALEVALRDGFDAPQSATWLAAPAAALVVLPLLLRRRWARAMRAAV